MVDTGCWCLNLGWMLLVDFGLVLGFVIVIRLLRVLLFVFACW